MSVPSSKPKLTASEAEQILKSKKIDRKTFPVCVLAVRGYYLNSMGKRGANDRGIYDDAAFICSPTLFASVNWNTDPSSYRKGRGRGSSKGMASLKLGVWDYKIGRHKKVYPAGNQADAVTVIRDGIDGDYEDMGWFGINLHPGGRGTSSLGCQTAPPNQWPSFITPLVAELKRYDQKTFKYVLIDSAQMDEILKGPPGPPIEPPFPGDGKFSPRSLKNLFQCHTDLQRLAYEVRKEMDIEIICGHRNEADQNKAFREGKSKLKWPNSKHNKTPSLAYDACPNPIDWKNIAAFEKMREITKKCAARLGIKIRLISWDKPHVELA